MREELRAEFNYFDLMQTTLPLDRLAVAQEVAIPVYRQVRHAFDSLGMYLNADHETISEGVSCIIFGIPLFVCSSKGRQFGFQPDNLANQHEHLMLLLSNQHSQLQTASFTSQIALSQSGYCLMSCCGESLFIL